MMLANPLLFNNNKIEKATPTKGCDFESADNSSYIVARSELTRGCSSIFKSTTWVKREKRFHPLLNMGFTKILAVFFCCYPPGNLYV